LEYAFAKIGVIYPRKLQQVPSAALAPPRLG
jgi:hypothetical protein